MSKLVHAILDGARSVEASFTEADDDWVPVMAIAMEDGTAGMVDVRPYFADDESKRFFGGVFLPALVDQLSAIELVLLNSAYTVDPEVWDESQPRPTEHPDRIEVVVVTRITVDGVEQWMAHINRDPRGEAPPTLGEFKHMGGEVESYITNPALERMRTRANSVLDHTEPCGTFVPDPDASIPNVYCRTCGYDVDVHKS